MAGMRKIIDDYLECNKFEIRIVEDKVYIYFYDDIIDFSSKIVKLKGNNNLIIIKGDNLIIETLFKNFLIISGNVIEMVLKNE